MTNFGAHGKLTGYVDGSIFVIEGEGPWNMECFANPNMDVEAIHKQLDGTRWGVLSVIRGDAVHTPEAIEYLTGCVLSDQKVGRCATAVVLESSQFTNFSKNHLAQIYNAANETFEFFDTISLAKKWLNDQIRQS